MKIEVMGTGCYKCIKLETLLNEVLIEVGRTDVSIVRISDEKIILNHIPLEEIPALLIDGLLVSSTDVPDRSTLVEWLKFKETAT
jgi:hypothetical protein